VQNYEIGGKASSQSYLTYFVAGSVFSKNKAPPLPTGVLKRVLATHPYTGEYEDELSFVANEVFCVLPYEDPEEADDGWYFGFIESKPDVKGVFPANFTRPVDSGVHKF
jgi:hypothetical protein